MWFIDTTILISIFFKFANLAILLGLGTYVFKRYLVKPMRAQIDERNRLEQKLVNEYNEAQEVYRLQELRRIDERKLWERLYAQTIRWHSLSEEEMSRQRELDKKYLQEQKDRIAQQQDQVALDNLRDDILPHAVAKATAQLEAMYDGQRGKTVVEQIMKLMQKERS